MSQQSEPTKREETLFRHPSLTFAQEQQFSHFAQLLQQGNRQTNLTRITETADIYQRHFADAFVALPLLDAQGEVGRLLDVGSGAGLPGLALAIARPSWHIDSLEATGKKVCFQREAVTQMVLANVAVIQGRAEDLAHQLSHREVYDMVTARAVAALPLLLELCLPFVKTGGLFIAFKGPNAPEELSETKSACAVLGGEALEVVPYTLKPRLNDTSQEKFSLNLVVVRKRSQTPSIYPRVYSVMRRKPL